MAAGGADRFGANNGRHGSHLGSAGFNNPAIRVTHREFSVVNFREFVGTPAKMQYQDYTARARCIASVSASAGPFV